MSKVKSGSVGVGRQARATRMLVGVVFALSLSTGRAAAQEPSTDRKNPTPFASNSVEGEYDGDATTHYWRFTAGKGEVKLTATAKTKDYSTLMDVELLDEAGRSLEKFSVVANASGRSESRARTFVRRQPVIVKVFMREDRDIKHLKYELELAGAVEADGGAGATGGQAAAAQTTATGDRMCLPASGTLMLVTKTGESYEIDLSQVVKASVKN
ncbi:MAG TPA: hypothetical protein VEX70_01655 [Pyrinomonadaceae bacterium]|nr:hypothetical protein [Pyrinomonadaceae bacterium]